jgi:hypothetical protein
MKLTAEELINKHLELVGGKYQGIKDGNVYEACINAINEAINYSQCCKSDSEQLVCEKCNGTGGYSYTDEIGFNYKTCECQTN